MEAVLENQLHGWKDWRDAASPIGWVKDCTESIHQQDHTQGGALKKTDALYRAFPMASQGPSVTADNEGSEGDVSHFEEVAEIPGELNRALSRRYTQMALGTLIAAVGDDQDLRDYMQLRFQGFKPRATWDRLGWSESRGRAVDRRFRRLREKVKATGFEYQTREIERDPGMSDASCMVVKERLRIPVPARSEATLSGRVVYEPRAPGGEIDGSD